MKKVSWGVLGVAKIATEKVIPAMQRSAITRVDAIASRSLAKAQKAARSLGIQRAYGSYEELLADPAIEAIYNPLPNHLHVPWSIQALEAGKHVLCEKPLALSVEEARTLVEARDRSGKLVTEAFMVKTHPQWLKTRELVRRGRIGKLRAIQGFFSYHNTDASNIRNQPEAGGGALLDIGCYPITTSRFVLGEEPTRVAALVERDPTMQIDRLTSFLLEYPSGHATFACSTQLVPYQRMHFFGTEGRIEVEIPFNAPPDSPCRVFVDDGSDLRAATAETIEFPICDQYTIQGDVFSRALRGDEAVEFPLEDALANLAVIEAVFRAGESGKWETP